MGDTLIRITESPTQAAIRWSKRALEAEAKLRTPTTMLRSDWVDCGLYFESVFAGQRIHYHRLRGEPGNVPGVAMEKPRLGESGHWVVRVDLDDGCTIDAAFLKHLSISLDDEPTPGLRVWSP